MNRKQKCIEFVLSKKYGDTIKTEEIAEILGYNINDEKELKRCKKNFYDIKNKLIEYGYILKSLNNIGYYILKPKHISSYCYRTYIKKAENLLEKSNYIIDNVDKKELSEIRKEEYSNMKILHVDLIDNIENTIIDSSYFENKEKYDNLED